MKSPMFFRKQRGIAITRLLARDGMGCAICSLPLDRRSLGNDLITFDHIVPRSRGGLDTWENIRLVHLRCNQLKGCLLDEEVDRIDRKW